jgi:hypothetical protein
VLRKKIAILLILIFHFGTLVNSQELAVQKQDFNNKIIATVDKETITELDVKKEILFYRFINNISKDKELNHDEIVKNLVNEKIKKFEVESDQFKNYLKIDDKEINNSVYYYLQQRKVSIENFNQFCKKNEILNSYLKDKIVTEMKWDQLINGLYNRNINIAISEINKQVENIKDENEKETEKNKIINKEKEESLMKYSLEFLEKSKKKYVINYL